MQRSGKVSYSTSAFSLVYRLCDHSIEVRVTISTTVEITERTFSWRSSNAGVNVNIKYRISGLVERDTNPITMTEANGSSSPTRSSPTEGPSSRTDVSPQVPAQDTTPADAGDTDGQARRVEPGGPLEVYNWDDLEDRFTRKMEQCQAVEIDIYKEFNTLLAVRTRACVHSKCVIDVSSGIHDVGTDFLCSRRR